VNLAKIFKRAATEECIIFIDEFDSLGKVRDYNQDHGEMKRVVNTILQLFDYLPQESIIISATNQINIVDPALLRRFDVRIHLDIPNKSQIKELINKTLKSGLFTYDEKKLPFIIGKCLGLSYYAIQKALITTIKRSILDNIELNSNKIKINTTLWIELIDKEKQNFSLKK
jgi:AAA+ superfamily predicted ATPase